MNSDYQKYFKFESSTELLKASFNHRQRHKALLTKVDLDLLGWIVLHNRGLVASKLMNELPELTNLSIETIDHSYQKLITLGIIERMEKNIDGVPTTLYPMLPFEGKLDDFDGLNDLKELNNIKKIYVFDEGSIRFVGIATSISMDKQTRLLTI